MLENIKNWIIPIIITLLIGSIFILSGYRRGIKEREIKEMEKKLFVLESRI